MPSNNILSNQPQSSGNNLDNISVSAQTPPDHSNQTYQQEQTQQQNHYPHFSLGANRMHSNLSRLWLEQQNRQELERRQGFLRR
jgi:hypothetical protein